jgi:hypothetical protein
MLCPPNRFSLGVHCKYSGFSHSLCFPLRELGLASHRNCCHLSAVITYPLLLLKGMLIKNITMCFVKIANHFNTAPCPIEYRGLPNHKILPLASSLLPFFPGSQQPSYLQ